MRIKLPSNKVWEGTPEEILRRLHSTSAAHKNEAFLTYLEGFVERLKPVRIWIAPPAGVRADASAFATWLGAEMLRLKRWQETTDPTEEEKAAKAAEAAKAKAAAAAAAKASAPAAPATGTPAPAAPAAPASPGPQPATPASPGKNTSA